MPIPVNAILTILLMTVMCGTQPRLPQRGLCAHRGASFTHPENTLSAFQEAIRLGAHMIEFDVQMSRDSVLVIIHDKNVAHTTNGAGLVSELTLIQLKALDAGSWKDGNFRDEKIPTLMETLAIMPKNIWLNIHIRGGVNVGLAAAKMIVQEKRSHQAIFACDTVVASAVNRFDDSLLICNMERMAGSDEYVELTIRTKAEFIQLREREKKYLAACLPQLRQAGIKVNYYYADSASQLKELFAQGVDFPLVNNLAAMMQAADELGIAPVKPVL